MKLQDLIVGPLQPATILMSKEQWEDLLANDDDAYIPEGAVETPPELPQIEPFPLGEYLEKLSKS